MVSEIMTVELKWRPFIFGPEQPTLFWNYIFTQQLLYVDSQILWYAVKQIHSTNANDPNSRYGYLLFFVTFSCITRSSSSNGVCSDGSVDIISPTAPCGLLVCVGWKVKHDENSVIWLKVPFKKKKKPSQCNLSCDCFVECFQTRMK